MYDDITGFIRLLDELTDHLFKLTGRMPLCILDGMDHADPAPCQKALRAYYSTVTKPKLSKLFVIPLYLLMDTQFAPNIAEFHSTLPNVKVFAAPGSQELAPGGFQFYRTLISKYADLELFEPEALESLFRLSAGIVRDMIRFTGDACGYATDAGADRVGLENARKVWSGEMARLHLLISRADLEILEEVEQHPRPRGADGLSYLLFRKAILCYPNDVDWFGVHPALREYFKLDNNKSAESP